MSLAEIKPQPSSSATTAATLTDTFHDQQLVSDAPAAVLLWLQQLLRAKHGCEYRLLAADQSSWCGSDYECQQGFCSSLQRVAARGLLANSCRHVDDQLVIKLLPEEPLMKQLVVEHKMALCETMVYKHMLPSLVQHESLHGGCDVQQMIVPCLYANLMQDVAECAIVLENVQHCGFKTIGTLNIEKCQMNTAIRSLARFAATSHSWLTHTSDEDLSYLHDNCISASNPVHTFIAMGMDRMSTVLESRGRFRLLSRLRSLTCNITHALTSLLQQHGAFSVICHGDYRDGNLLARQDAVSGEWHMKVLDWQVCRLGSPVLDLVYLLLFSTSRKWMVHEERHCLDLYRHHFNEKLASLGCSRRYNSCQMDEDFARAKLVGLLWCLAALKIWETVDGWAEHTLDLLEEVDSLGLLDRWSSCEGSASSDSSQESAVVEETWL